MSVNMTTTNAISTNGQWKPRKTEPFTCSSGQIVQIRRPGPEFALRASRTVRTFSKTKKKVEVQGESTEEFGVNTLAAMSDEELAAVMIFARELVCAMVVSPKLVLSPRPGANEIGPDDIGDDFWELFNYGMTGFFGLKVPVANEEVEVADLKSFRPESGVPGDSVNSPEVRTDPEQSVGNSGLDDGP